MNAWFYETRNSATFTRSDMGMMCLVKPWGGRVLSPHVESLDLTATPAECAEAFDRWKMTITRKGYEVNPVCYESMSPCLGHMSKRAHGLMEI
jgi:hypothetical protein